MSHGIKRNNNFIIVGTGMSSATAKTYTLKAAPTLSYFHVYQLDPSTTEKNLVCYLKIIIMFPEVICNKLESKYPDK